MVGVVATWILPSTLEDILAIVLAGLAGYVALLNLPLRRAEAKGKLERVASNFIQVRNMFSPNMSMVRKTSPASLSFILKLSGA